MVLLTIKTLKNATFTVLELKQKIGQREQVDASLQKLIHSGKILVDSQKLADYSLQEKDFIVLMVTKPTKPKEAIIAPSVAAPAAVAPPSNPSIISTSAPSSGSNDTSLATGANYNAAVDNLVEMGFPMDQVKAAMKAAFNNPDRAAEYLMTGIPEGLEQQQTAPPATQTVTQSDVPAASPTAPFNMFAPVPAAGAGTAAQPSDFSFLRNSPQFQQLRQLVQTQPQLLQPVLAQLGQSNPQLLQAINSNPDAFLQMLTEGTEGGSSPGGAPPGLSEGGAPPGQVEIRVTPEEEAAINRLTGLGFERGNVIEAYFACDKNEELAANYLFDAQGSDW